MGITKAIVNATIPHGES